MKRIICVALLLIPFYISKAQEVTYEVNWYVPDHAKLQFAGNIGFLSIGAGYLHGRNKLETDLMVGFLPKSIGGDHIATITAKMTYFPIKKVLSNKLNFYPISVGPYISYSFGSQFDTFLPNEYPEGYYWWATSMRFGAYIGGKFEFNLSATNSKLLSFYYELGTYDLLVLSYALNREYLNIDDIFSLALGVKLQLR